MGIKQLYSKLLHNSAKKWGIKNSYQPGPLQIVESLVWRGKPKWLEAKINLFMCNGQWGYCLDVTTKNRGFCYGPYLKFCNPHSTRHDAISAATVEIVNNVQDGDLIRWARSLTELKQLNLF